MKIAVIGATGRLGSAVAHEAAARGHQVTPPNAAASMPPTRHRSPALSPGTTPWARFTVGY